MLASFLTTVLFSFSVILAARSARVLGPGTANLRRICLATAFLALRARGFGAGLRGPALPWFFLSGIIGFGLGNLVLFGALPRIGPRPGHPPHPMPRRSPRRPRLMALARHYPPCRQPDQCGHHPWLGGRGSGPG